MVRAERSPAAEPVLAPNRVRARHSMYQLQHLAKMDSTWAQCLYYLLQCIITIKMDYVVQCKGWENLENGDLLVMERWNHARRVWLSVRTNNEMKEREQEGDANRPHPRELIPACPQLKDTIAQENSATGTLFVTCQKLDVKKHTKKTGVGKINTYHRAEREFLDNNTLCVLAGVLRLKSCKTTLEELTCGTWGNDGKLLDKDEELSEGMASKGNMEEFFACLAADTTFMSALQTNALSTQEDHCIVHAAVQAQFSDTAITLEDFWRLFARHSDVAPLYLSRAVHAHRKWQKKHRNVERGAKRTL
ncbi:hypothetical protein EDC04DRAFT_2616217, partial [Pisolithus marmoratus]